VTIAKYGAFLPLLVFLSNAFEDVLHLQIHPSRVVLEMNTNSGRKHLLLFTFHLFPFILSFTMLIKVNAFCPEAIMALNVSSGTFL
jgi:hypothetical protein